MTPTSLREMAKRLNAANDARARGIHSVGQQMEIASALLDAARQIEGLEAECRAWHLVRDSKGERVNLPIRPAATFTMLPVRVNLPIRPAATFTMLPVLPEHLAAADAARAANKATDAHAARGV